MSRPWLILSCGGVNMKMDPSTKTVVSTNSHTLRRLALPPFFLALAFCAFAMRASPSLVNHRTALPGRPFRGGGDPPPIYTPNFRIFPQSRRMRKHQEAGIRPSLILVVLSAGLFIHSS